MLTAGFRSVAPVTCRVVPSSLFILVSSVCKALQCLISALTQGGEGGHLFRCTCSVVLWEGRDTANKYLWRVWGVLAVCGPHCICPSSPQRVLSQSILLRLLVALQGCCPKWALHFQHFPGLSCSGSGSRVLHKCTDSVGHAFCAFPRSEQLRRPGAWRVLCPKGTVCLNHLPGPSHSVSWVFRKSAVSGALCVSSGELVSGCNPPGRCQRPGPREDLVRNLEPVHSLVEGAVSGAKIAPWLPALAAACLPLCLHWCMGRLTLGWLSFGIR